MKTLFYILTGWVAAIFFACVALYFASRRPGQALESEDGAEADSRRDIPTGTLASAPVRGGEGWGEEDP